MPPRRRRLIVGLATVVLGASGFVATGAFNVGSIGSRGTDWIQVAGVNQQVRLEAGEGRLEVDPDDDGDGGDGDGGDGDGGDGAGGDGDGGDGDGGDGAGGDGDGGDGDDDGDGTDTPTDPSPTPTPTDPSPTPTPTDPGGTTRVQIVTDPTDDGNLVNSVPALQFNGRFSGSAVVEGDADGFLEGFSVSNANKRAVSRVGFVDEQGHADGRPAFLVANVGPAATPGRGGAPVELRAQVYDADGDPVDPADQFSLPYRVDVAGSTATSGTDLLADAVRLPVGGLTAVVIEIDSRNGTDAVGRIATLEFGARDPTD